MPTQMTKRHSSKRRMKVFEADELLCRRLRELYHLHFVDTFILLEHPSNHRLLPTHKSSLRPKAITLGDELRELAELSDRMDYARGITEPDPDALPDDEWPPEEELFPFLKNRIVKFTAPKQPR